MTDAIIKFFQELLNNDILTIFIISMIPIVELRGAVPVAIKMGFSWYEAFGYAFLGSIIVAPILLLILMPILNAMKKIKVFRGLANAVESLFQSKAESVRKKANKADSKNTEDIIKIIGVFLFVAIPLPLTGVWTGTAVAVFLGLGFWKSLLAVSVGNISAGLIMTGLSLLFKDHLNLFLTIFMAVVLGVLLLNIIYLVIKSHLKKKKALLNNNDNLNAENVKKCEDDKDGQTDIESVCLDNENDNYSQKTIDNTNPLSNNVDELVKNSNQSINQNIDAKEMSNSQHSNPKAQVVDNKSKSDFKSQQNLKVDFSNIQNEDN